MSQVYWISGGRTHAEPLSARRAGGPESGVLQEGEVEIQQSRRAAQRPFLGRWLVLMDPIWFQQSHLAATHRRRTAASGTNEFQIRPDSQLQHKYHHHPLTRINRAPEKIVEGHTG